MQTLNRTDLINAESKMRKSRFIWCAIGLFTAYLGITSIIQAIVNGSFGIMTIVFIVMFFAIALYSVKKMADIKSSYNSVKNDDYYIELVPILKKAYTEDIETVTHFICFSEGEEVKITYREYKEYEEGDMFYVVRSTENRSIRGYFSAKHYELGDDIADKLKKAK